MAWQTGTIRVASVGGISIDVHFTFGLVIVWGGWQGWLQYGNLTGVIYGIIALVFFFGCVLLHELGHVWQARRVGMSTSRITLLPIGGLAEIKSPLSPWHELVIAMSGPLVNLALAIILGFITYALLPYSPFSREWINELFLISFTSPNLTGLVLYLTAANVMLFIFNMLPAFPMDGGRVIRAGLALIMDYELATRIAAGLGRIMALAMGLLGTIGWPPTGLPPNPLLIVVALVVYFGARQEELNVRRKRALVRVEVGEICQRSIESVAPWDTVTGALVARLFKNDRTLPVVVDNRVVGLLTYGDVRRRGNIETIAHLMRTDFPTLKPSDTLWVALREMDAQQLGAIPVVQDNVFRGMVSLEDISHAWRFVLRQRRRN